MRNYLSLYELEGKVALITGAANGIGAEVARAFYSVGASVVISDLDVEQGQALADELGERALFLSLDVTSETDWEAVILATEARFGGLHVLVNNAGMFYAESTQETSLAMFRKVQEINVDGVFLGCKHAMPLMAKSASAGDRASIINLSSVAGMVGQPFVAAYNASKGAVRLLTKSLAMECAHTQQPIRVNSVHPCIVKTDMGSQVLEDIAKVQGVTADEAEQGLIAQHPLGQFAEARDIAVAALYLASDASRMMTGSELLIDAGFCAQ